MTEQIDEGDADDAVNVKDEVRLLRSCDLLDFEGIVQQGSCGEVAHDEILDDLNTFVRVIHL